MSSRRRRHSGPPPQYSRGPSNLDGGYYHPRDYSPRASSIYTDRVPRPPPYEPAYPRSETWPSQRAEPVRGRGRERYHSPYRSDFHDDAYARRAPPHYDEPRSRRSRPYSHDRMSDRGSPHSRYPPSRHDRMPREGSRLPRSQSTSTPKNRQRGNSASQWWQHPVVRTCAMTAVSTGLSAALDSRGDPGAWKGAKGAKVAVASLGSALVDGFLGQKHPNSVRQEVVRKGVQVAMNETEKKKREPSDRGRQGERHRERQRDDGHRDGDDRHHRRRHSEGSRRHGDYH